MPLPCHPPTEHHHRLQNILIYIHKCNQNENYPDMNSFVCSLMYVLFYHIVFKLCNKAGWWIRFRGWKGNDHSRNHSVDALKWLPACSSSFYGVHIYSKNHGYFIKHFFFNVWVVFVYPDHRTVAATQSLHLHWVHADILPSLLVRAVPCATDLFSCFVCQLQVCFI